MPKNMLLILVFMFLGYFVFVVVIPEETTSRPTSQDNVVQAPYGAWESPLTAARIFEESDQISSLTVDGDKLFFIEKERLPTGEIF